MSWLQVAVSWLFFLLATCAAIAWNKSVQAANDPMAFSRAVTPANLGPIASVKPAPKPAVVKPVKRVKPAKIATK